jgi:hypothetical protein
VVESAIANCLKLDAKPNGLLFPQTDPALVLGVRRTRWLVVLPRRNAKVEELLLVLLDMSPWKCHTSTWA